MRHAVVLRGLSAEAYKHVREGRLLQYPAALHWRDQWRSRIYFISATETPERRKPGCAAVKSVLTRGRRDKNQTKVAVLKAERCFCQ